MSSVERIRFSPATLSSRIVAVGVDLLIGTCGVLIVLMVWLGKSLNQMPSVDSDPEEVNQARAVILLAAMTMPFLFAIAVARQGATPGKALMSLSVRNVATGRFPNYPRALGRETLRFLHLVPFIVIQNLQIVLAGLIIGVMFDMSRTRLSQTWYDRVLQTVIVAPVVERE